MLYKIKSRKFLLVVGLCVIVIFGIVGYINVNITIDSKPLAVEPLNILPEGTPTPTSEAVTSDNTETVSQPPTEVVQTVQNDWVQLDSKFDFAITYPKDWKQDVFEDEASGIYNLTLTMPGTTIKNDNLFTEVQSGAVIKIACPYSVWTSLDDMKSRSEFYKNFAINQKDLQTNGIAMVQYNSSYEVPAVLHTEFFTTKLCRISIDQSSYQNNDIKQVYDTIIASLRIK